MVFYCYLKYPRTYNRENVTSLCQVLMAIYRPRIGFEIYSKLESPRESFDELRLYIGVLVDSIGCDKHCVLTVYIDDSEHISH